MPCAQDQGLVMENMQVKISQTVKCRHCAPGMRQSVESTAFFKLISFLCFNLQYFQVRQLKFLPQESPQIMPSSKLLSASRRTCQDDHLCIVCQLCSLSPITVFYPVSKMLKDMLITKLYEDYNTMKSVTCIHDQI